MKFIKYFDAGLEQDTVKEFSDYFGISEKVMKIIVNRGYDTKEKVSNFLWPEKLEMQSPFTLKGMRDAVDIVKKHVENKNRILVFGDYDVDGISATAILIKTLKIMGADYRYFLPNRYVDGYGLTKAVLDKVKRIYNPDLIVTVDCGITAVEEVEYAKSLGIEMVVTDHHEIGETLPNCTIVNTKFTNQEYRFRGLCGTGVAYKLAEALIGTENCEEFLPIVAIATIADIVPLTSENRILIRLGFERMQLLPVGIKQMFSANKVSISKPDASDIAFKIAPKLNASGRMGDAVDSLLLYLETNPVKIKDLIEKIHTHNMKRQALGQEVYLDCKNMLNKKDITNMPAIILWKDNWDHGVLGIECSKLLEEFNRPVFLFTKEGDCLKGSARSINDINIHNILTSVSDILEVFGGHTMAAGLTLKLENFDEFVTRVNSYIYENINFKAFEPIEYYDCELELGEINQKFVDDLKVLEPCGAENSKPRFLIKADKINIQPLNKSSGHANIIFGKNLSLIFFNYIKEASKLNFGARFKFIFEFQETRGKYFKGIVKNFDFNNSLKHVTSKYVECYCIHQLQYSNTETPANYKTYTARNLLDFVLDCSKSVFGTLFIANTVAAYENFINTYDLSNIYSLNVVDCCSSGYNSVLLAPKDLSFAKKYKRIVFLDSVLDLSYISKLNQETKAEVYLSSEKKYSKTLFDNLYLDRKHFARIYQELIKYENTEFVSLLSVYSSIVKDNKIKYNFNNIIVPFYVFKQLNIVEINDGKIEFIYKINQNIKTELTKSGIYNLLNLIKKTIG